MGHDAFLDVLGLRGVAGEGFFLGEVHHLLVAGAFEDLENSLAEDVKVGFSIGL